MTSIPWDQPATLIDLDGKTPIIGTIRECVMHFAIFKPFAKEQARILLTRPVHREGRKTRTWCSTRTRSNTWSSACAQRANT